MPTQSPYKRLYPDQEVLTFDGGLDNKFPKALIPENESPDCLNVEFFDGAVGTRQGAVKLNTTPCSYSAAFDGLYTRRDNSNAETMIAFIGGHMLTLGSTTFITVPSAQSVFTIGSRVGAEMSENYLFIGNGGAGPYKWDGTYFTQHGISAPTQTATVNSGTTGSLSTGATYYYCYTNVNSALVESNISPISTFVVTATGAGLAAVVSSIASGASLPSQGINARWLYRSKANVSGAYFRVTKLSDVSTNTYTDTLADASLGAQSPTDNGTPPQYNAICYCRNILFVNDVANPNFVWYSVPGQPYTFPSTNFFKVGDKTSDLVKGFASYDNYIVIFCEQSTWINYMSDPATPSTWRQIRTNSPYGSSSPYCAIECNVRGENLLLHPAVQNKKFVGFGALSGATLDPSVTLQPITSVGSDLQSQVIEPDMFSVQQTYLKNISGIVYKNRAFVSLTFGSGKTTNNRIYVWDYSMSNIRKDQKASWVPWTGTPYSVQQFTIYGGSLYGCTSTTSGFVYKLADTNVYDDDGAAINSYFWTKEFSGFTEDTNYTKDFRYVNLLVDMAGSYYMNLTYKTDSDQGSGTSTQINLTSGGTNWGPGMTWGTSTWGGGVSQSEVRVYLGGSVRGKRLQLQFSNQNAVDQRFKVHRGQILYNIKGYR